MDQIPMPFIVDQSSSFTFEDDEHVQVRGTGAAEGFSTKKKKDAAHDFVNTNSTSDNTYGHVDLICRGAGRDPDP